MKNVYVLRYPSRPEGVFGTMFDDNRMPFAVTLENVDTLFAPGVYSCFRRPYYAGGYDTFCIDVPNRSAILFHKLNFQRQSAGCIGIAEAFEDLFDKKTGQLTPAISASEDGFNEFWTKYKEEDNIMLQVHQSTWPLPY